MPETLCTCPACGREVSRAAGSCPHCGRPTPAVGDTQMGLNLLATSLVKIVGLLVLIGLVVVGCLVVAPALFGAALADDRAYHKVVEIYDGDTIAVKVEWADYARLERVRLIGVNAPERGADYAAEATLWLENLLKGEEVRLEYSPGPHPGRDRYGRILAYVHRPGIAEGAGEFDVNLELVAQGYARLYPGIDHRRLDEFEAAVAHARTRAKGIWAVPKL